MRATGVPARFWQHLKYVALALLIGLLLSTNDARAAACTDVFPAASTSSAPVANRLDLAGVPWSSTPVLPAGGLNLTAGNHYYGGANYSGTNGWTITVPSGATTILFINGNLSLRNNAQFNVGGNPQDLIIIINGSLTVQNNFTARALIYATGSISAANGADVVGALTAHSTVSFGSVQPVYSAAAVAAANFGTMCTQAAYITPLAFDDFSSYGNGSLNGANGGTGWGGAWSGAAGVQNVVDLSASPMTYLAPNGHSVHETRGLQFTGNNASAAVRNLPGPVNTGTVYVSMLVRYRGTPHNNDFFSLWLENSGDGLSPQFGIRMNRGSGAGPEDFFVRLDNGGAHTTDIQQDRTYLVVAEYTKNGTSFYNQARLWINPDCTSTAGTPTVTTDNPSHQLQSFSRIGFRTANLSGDDQVTVGQVAVGTQWGDVVRCRCRQNGLIGRYFNNYTDRTQPFPGGNGDLVRRDADVNFNWGNGSPDSAINAEQFAAAWEGQIEATVTGDYHFSTVTDDGVRLWINGVLLIDHWFDQAPSRREAASLINLQAGQRYDIRMEYYENFGGAVAQLEWIPPGGTRQTVPSSQLFACIPVLGPTLLSASLPCGATDQVLVTFATGADRQPLDAGVASAPARYQVTHSSGTAIAVSAASVDPTTGQVQLALSSALQSGDVYTLTVNGITDQDGRLQTPDPASVSFIAANGNGLVGTYFANRTLTAPAAFMRVDTQVDFDWGTSSADPAQIGVDNYSVRWTGYLEAPETGEYRFWTESDDGVRLWVGDVSGTPVINNWTDHASTWDSSALITLQAGQRYAIRMDYYENGGFAMARLHWETPSNGTRHAIPAPRFYGCPTGGGTSVHHFEIVHDGTALTCAAESVTVRACGNASCTSLHFSPVTVTLSPPGWAGGETQTLSNGTGTFSLRRTTPGTVTLNVTGTPSAGNPTLCQSGSSTLSTANCDLSFADSGFLFDIPTQIANRTSSAISFRAVRTDDATQQCVPDFQNTTRTIGFWSSYVSPGPSGRPASRPLAVNGAGISGSESAPTPLNIAFDNSGSATLSIHYSDAGVMQLNARHEGTGSQAGLIMTGSDQFLVKPAGLCVQTASTCSAGNHTCPPFHAAGQNFPVTIRAMAWEVDGDTDLCDNMDTPNFSLSGIRLSHTLVAPAGGAPGNLSQTSYDHLPSANATSTVNLSLSEVGVFRISADPLPNSYHGEPLDGGTSANIGRITPAHYVVTVEDPGSYRPACTTPAPGFTYTGQDFLYNAFPILRVSARNALDQVTTNHRGPFVTLTSTHINRATPVSLGNPGPALQVTFNTGILSDDPANPGELLYDYHLGDTYRYQKLDPLSGTLDPAARVGPFTADIQQAVTSVVDPDGVSASVLPAPWGPAGSTEIRYGRLRLDNAFGPETDRLRLPLRLEFWDGSRFVNNTADSCLAYHSNNLSDPPAWTSKHGIGNFVLGEADGDGLWLSAPGIGTTGQTSLSYSAPAWLQHDWSVENVPSNPSANVAFGRYRGNDRIIFWRESAE